jgi:hypothetical protein
MGEFLGSIGGADLANFEECYLAKLGRIFKMARPIRRESRQFLGSIGRSGGS